MGRERNHFVWNSEGIDKIKAEVRTSLENFAEDDRSGRLAFAMRKITEFTDADTPNDKIKRLVYCISALSHHARFGGLRNRDCKQLSFIANTLLKSEKIEIGSRLGFLFGELHLALSQISVARGRHQEAVWEQQMSAYLFGESVPARKGLALLAGGIRKVRIGQASQAQKLLSDATTADLVENNRIRAWFGLIQSLRLGANYVEARRAAEVLSQHPSLSTIAKVDVEWELAMLDAIAASSPGPIMVLMRRNSPHYQAIYILEAKLWGFAAAKKEFATFLPKLLTLSRKKALMQDAKGPFYDLVMTIENCYDPSIPHQLRLARLGEAFANRSMLKTIDRELLFLAAAARWLARERLTTMAALVLGEYTALCQKLSQGRIPDTFHIIGDLLDRDWYLQTVRQPSPEIDAKPGRTETRKGA